MRIKESDKPGRVRLFFSRLSAVKKYLVIGALVILIVTFFAALWANAKVKTKGFSNLAEFITYTSKSYIRSFRTSPETVTLDIKQEHFQKLKEKRDQALKRGLIINEEDSYVPGKIRYKDKTYDINIRLKGHMTDHIQGQKWSFRVKVKSKEPFMGMKIFSLQHPGTRGYIYEWIYHQLMKNEQIIALRYGFVKLDLNGKDLGIYAIEENFDQELILSNKRPPGPIMRFNPDLYWVDRYQEILKNRTEAEFAEYNSANVEPYRTDKVLADSIMRRYFLRGQNLIESFRRGHASVTDVFDIKYLARFHAIIDLVGGHHSLDWSDIKYYYNPQTDKLEPVAYESFTVFPSKQISGSYRFKAADQNNFHNRLFSDETFFREYISNLERITEPAYLRAFFNRHSVEIENNLDILNAEFPYKKFSEDQYYKNQKAIRQILNMPKAFHAFQKSFNGEILTLNIGSIASLPCEIKEITVDGKTVAQLDTTVIIEPKENDRPVKYRTYAFRLQEPVNADKRSPNFSVNYTVLGSSKVRVADVFSYDIDTSFRKTILPQGGDFTAEFIVKDDSAKQIILKAGNWKLDKPLVLPSGYKVFAESGFNLDIRNGAMILSSSPLTVKGTAERPVTFASSDGNGRGILVMNAAGPSVFRFVNFTNLKPPTLAGRKITGSVSFIDSPVSFTDCSFSSVTTEDGLNINGSSVTVTRCKFTDMANDALDAQNCTGVVTNSTFLNCRENAIDLMMGSLVISALEIGDIGDKALNIKAGGTLTGRNIHISKAVVGISGEDLSEVELNAVTIEDSRYGAISFTNKKEGGCANVRLTDVILKQTVNAGIVEECSTLIINGKEFKEKVKDAEKAIK